MKDLLLLLLAFQIKHFVFDWLYQPPFMWKNKGTFGHIGGIVHSGIHALVTAIILALIPGGPWKVIVALAALEFAAHYLIDWAKMNTNRIMGWTATTHHAFWVLTGLDQLLHQLTYLALAAYWVSLW